MIMPVVVSTPAKVNVVGNVAVWNVLDVQRDKVFEGPRQLGRIDAARGAEYPGATRTGAIGAARGRRVRGPVRAPEEPPRRQLYRAQAGVTELAASRIVGGHCDEAVYREQMDNSPNNFSYRSLILRSRSGTLFPAAARGREGRLERGRPAQPPPATFGRVARPASTQGKDD